MFRKILKERLSEALDARGLSAKQLAQDASLPKEVIDDYLDAGAVPDHEAMKRISECLGVSLPYLMDWNGPEHADDDEEQAIVYGIIGSITSNKDGHIVENYEDNYEVIPAPWLFDGNKEDYFVTRAHETQMSPTILPGDLLFCRKAPAVPNDTVAIVLRDGWPAGARIVQYDDNGHMMRLSSADPYAPSRVMEGDELEHCHVIGEVKRVLRTIPTPHQ